MACPGGALQLSEVQDEFLQPVVGAPRAFSETGWSEDSAFRGAVARVEVVVKRSIDLALDLAGLYRDATAVVFQSAEELLKEHEVRRRPPHNQRPRPWR